MLKAVDRGMTIEGVGLDEIAAETVKRHARAFSDDPVLRTALDVGGEYMYRVRGEEHVWTPDAVASLQHAVRKDSREEYREFAASVNDESARAKTIRGLFKIRTADDLGIDAVPLVLQPGEWERLEIGLAQRAWLLDAVLRDIGSCA